MNMRIHLAALSVFLLSVFPALAQEPARPSPPFGREGRRFDRNEFVAGRITEVTPSGFVLERREGGTVKVQFTAQTEFRKGRERAKREDFPVGTIILVRGTAGDGGTWVAQMVATRSGQAAQTGRGGPGGPGGGAGMPGRPGGPGGGMGMPGGPGGPGGGMGMPGGESIAGEVKVLKPPSLTILKPDGSTVTFELDENTALRKGGESITMADLRAGDHVVVRGEMRDGKFLPKGLNVVTPEQWERMMQMRNRRDALPASPPGAQKKEEEPPKPNPPEF